MNLESTPIKKPFMDSLVFNGKVWIQWLTTLGDALKGEWSEGARVLTFSSSLSADSNYFSFQGVQVFVNIVFNDKTATLDLSGTIQVLDEKNKPIQFLNGMLNLYDGETLVQGVSVVGTNINLPTLTTSGKTIITGTLVLKR